MYPSLRLKKDEERRLLAGHLWVYSNEIDIAATPLTAISSGSLVTLASSRGRFLGIGYCNPHTLLCTRLLTRQRVAINAAFFSQQFKSALALRERFLDKPFYRLIYSESDRVPGLIVDRYGDICVVHITTLGLWQLKNEVIAALQTVLKPISLLIRTTAAAGTEEGLPDYNEEIGAPIPHQILIEENNAKFYVDLKQGQKTGWFYDQRANRERMTHYVKNKRVLDLCCYVGAFGIQAAMANAREVVCVDSSAHALQFVNENAKLNQVQEKVQTVNMAAMDYLKEARARGEQFDVIILDPPAFIKRRKDIKTGSDAYQRLNTLALNLLTDEGILISCSCSMQLSLPMLMDCVRKASLTSECDLQILALGFQDVDHPVHPAIPETAYLKVLFSRRMPAI